MEDAALRREQAVSTAESIVYEGDSGKLFVSWANNTAPYEPPSDFLVQREALPGTGLLDQSTAAFFLDFAVASQRPNKAPAVRDTIRALSAWDRADVPYVDSDVYEVPNDISSASCELFLRMRDTQRSQLFYRNLRRDDVVDSWTSGLRPPEQYMQFFQGGADQGDGYDVYGVYDDKDDDRVPVDGRYGARLDHEQPPLRRTYGIEDCNVGLPMLPIALADGAFKYPSPLRTELYRIWKESYDLRNSERRKPFFVLLWAGDHYSCIVTLDGVNWIHSDPLSAGVTHRGRVRAFLTDLQAVLLAENADLPVMRWISDSDLSSWPGAGYLRQKDAITCLIVAVSFIFYILDTRGVLYPFYLQTDRTLALTLVSRMRRFAVRLRHWIRRAERNRTAVNAFYA